MIKCYVKNDQREPNVSILYANFHDKQPEIYKNSSIKLDSESEEKEKKREID